MSEKKYFASILISHDLTWHWQTAFFPFFIQSCLHPPLFTSQVCFCGGSTVLHTWSNKELAIFPMAPKSFACKTRFELPEILAKSKRRKKNDCEARDYRLGITGQGLWSGTSGQGVWARNYNILWYSKVKTTISNFWRFFNLKRGTLYP